MKKLVLKTLFLAIVAVLLILPEKAEAGLGVFSKDNPCLYSKISLKEGSDFLAFFEVSGKASKVFLSVENLSGGDASVKVEFIKEIEGEEDFGKVLKNVIKSVNLKKGKKRKSISLPDFKDGEAYYISVKKPKFSGMKEMTVGVCVYSEGLGGKRHDFTKIILSKEEVDLGKGKTITLKASMDKALKKSGVVWTSSDTEIATVTKNGKVKAKKDGFALITCTSKKDKTISAQCRVYVYGDDDQDGNDPKDNDTEKKYGDEALLEEAKIILARTGQPLYLNSQGKNVSYQTDSSGKTRWSVVTNLNGTINYIVGYNTDTNQDYRTYFIRNIPCVSVRGSSGSSSIWDSVKKCSYDFEKDPSRLVIGWSLWTKDTSKKDLEAMLNTKISDEIYDSLINMAGGNVVIVYGKNPDGVLTGRFAGTVSYAYSSKSASYRFIGIAADNEDQYGKLTSGYVDY